MSGTPMGSLKAKLGLKGKVKPGDMLKKLNDMKCKKCGKTHKAGKCMGYKKPSRA